MGLHERTQEVLTCSDNIHYVVTGWANRIYPRLCCRTIYLHFVLDDSNQCIADSIASDARCHAEGSVRLSASCGKNSDDFNRDAIKMYDGFCTHLAIWIDQLNDFDNAQTVHSMPRESNYREQVLSSLRRSIEGLGVTQS